MNNLMFLSAMSRKANIAVEASGGGGQDFASYQTAPTLIDTDINSGSTTNGENSKGAYVSLFGYAFGTQAALGTAGGARVYFRHPGGDNAWHEVDNYRALNGSRVFATHQVARIIVQLGALGSIAAGAVCDVKVTVNGVDSNILSGHFTIQPGHFFFVSTSGNDGTGAKNNIAAPFRYLQQANGGSTFTGVFDPTTGVKPGDTIVLRAGTWSDQTGYESKWIRPYNQTGTAPNGSANNGYIHIVAYPGAAGAHAQEDVHFSGGSGCNGAITGCSTSRSALGYGTYFSVSGLRIEMPANAVADAAPIALQTNADYWRVYDCELGPWPSTLVTPNNAKAGGIAGSSVGGKFKFHYIHDIDCDANNPGTSALENHGIYFDTGHTTPSADCEFAYNRIENIPGGSCIQFQDTNGGPMTGMTVHHNWLDTGIKYGLNIALGTYGLNVWNNIIRNCSRNAIRWGNLDSDSTTVINLVHNTVLQPDSTNAYSMAITHESNIFTSGTVNINHNLVVLEAGAAAGGTEFHDFGAGQTNAYLSQNLYWDVSGVLTTVPTKDTNSAYGNPNFTDRTGENYTVTSGGAGLDACTLAETIAVVDDFYGIARPVTGTGSPGATKNDIGATEGIGT